MQIADLSDSFIAEWKPLFPKGKLVTASVLRYVIGSLDKDPWAANINGVMAGPLCVSVFKQCQRRVAADRPELAAKRDRPDAGRVGDLGDDRRGPAARGPCAQGRAVWCLCRARPLAPLWPVPHLRGTIPLFSKGRVGLFLSVSKPFFASVCVETRQVSDARVTPEELAQLYTEGDRVRVVVIKAEPEQKRLSLGMKQSYFDVEEEGETTTPAAMDTDEPALENEDDEDDADAGDDADDDNDEAEQEETAMEVDLPAARKASSTKAVPLRVTPLAVAAGFDWGGSNNSSSGKASAAKTSSADLESPDEASDNDDDDSGDSTEKRSSAGRDERRAA